MITEQKIRELINEHLEGTPVFLVEASVKSGNRISVFIDGDQGVTVSDCQALHQHLESRLDRDTEDFDLTVSSAGADQPLVMPRQYPRHSGRLLEVRTADGRTLNGKLISVADDVITLEIKGIKKAPSTIETVMFKDIKEARIILSFK